MHRYTIYLFLWNALHVSDGSSAHQQEIKTVYTASGILPKLYCYLPLPWKSWNCSSISSTTVAGSSKGFTKYPMLYIQIWAPDDGRRNRLKHVEHFTEINKLCNVVSFWLYIIIRLRCKDPWTPKRIFYGVQLFIPILILKTLRFPESRTCERTYELGWVVRVCKGDTWSTSFILF